MSKNSKYEVKTKRVNHKNKILICTDCHRRDLAWNIYNGQNKHEAISFVKHGGAVSRLSVCNKVKNEESDFIVFICGIK